MKIQSAIHKIRKYLGTEINKTGIEYWTEYNGQILSFCQNGNLDEAICFKVRDIDDVDDIQSDYSAGIFLRNLTLAINLIKGK